MSGNNDFSNVIQRLHTASVEVKPDPLRKASTRRAFLDQASLIRADLNESKISSKKIIPFKTRAISAVIVSVILAVGLLTGTVYASNSACPGDFLYPVDRAAEQIQINLTTNPYEQIQFMLSLTDERVSESEILFNNGDIQNLPVAIGGYYELVNRISNTMDFMQGDIDDLQQTVESVLSVHEQTLQALMDQVPEQALPGLTQALQTIQATYTDLSNLTRTSTTTPTLTSTTDLLAEGSREGTSTPTLIPSTEATQPGNAHANQTENTHRNNDLSHTPQGNGLNK
jgi:hypothetical protein